MGDGQTLTLACNLASQPAAAPLPGSRPFWGEAASAIPPTTTLAWLQP
jgi:hypothetical protein